MKTESLDSVFSKSVISGIFKHGDKLCATIRKNDRQSLETVEEYDIYEIDLKSNTNQHVANFNLDAMATSWIWGSDNKVLVGTHEGTIFQILM